MFAKRIVVTGMGLLSPLGVGARSSFEALRKGESGVKSLYPVFGKELYSKNREFLLAGGVIPRDQIKTPLSSTEKEKMGEHDLFALIAGEEALRDANWNPTNGNRTSVVVASAFGNISEISSAVIQYHHSHDVDLLPKYLISIIGVPSIHLGLHHRFEGPSFGVSAACAGGAYAIHLASMMITSGQADVVVVGGSELPLSPLGIGGFARIHAHVPENTTIPPENAVRPFDQNRSGTILGESAAIMVLESLHHALDRGAGDRIYAEILGCTSRRDGTAISRPDPIGEFHAMKSCLSDADVAPEDVDLVFAHATATIAGDAAEAEALKKIFGSQKQGPIICATKGATGHSLGAASAMDMVFALQSLNHSTAPKIRNLEKPDQCADGLRFANFHSTDRPLETAMVHGLGLAGTDSAVLFSTRGLPRSRSRG